MKRLITAMTMVLLIWGAIWITHLALAQNLAPADLRPRFVQAAPSPPTAEKRMVARLETVVDENGQKQNRVVHEVVPVIGQTGEESEPDLFREAEIQAARDAAAIVQQQQGAASSEQSELKEKLREVLTRQFDEQQHQHNREIANLEARLNQLKETAKKRNAAKETIVDKRLDQLTGVKDELAWEETPGVPSGVPGTAVHPAGSKPSLPTRTPGFGPGIQFPNSLPTMPPGAFPTAPSSATTPRVPPPPARTPQTPSSNLSSPN